MNVFIICVIKLLFTSSNFIMPFSALFISRHYQFDAELSGFIVTGISVSYLVGNIVGGICGDKYSPRLLLILFSLLSFLLMLVGTFVSEATASVCAFSLFSALAGAANPVMSYFVSNEVAHDKQGGAFGSLYLSHNIGIAIVYVGGGYMLDLSTIYPLLLFTVISGLCFVVTALFAPVPSRHSGSGQVQKSTVDSGAPLFVALSFLLFFGLAFMDAQRSYQLPIWLDSLKIPHSASLFGTIGVVNAVFVLVFTKQAIKITSIFSPISNMGVSALFYAIGFGAYYIAIDTYAILSLTVLWSIGEILGATYMNVFIAKNAPSNFKARLFSMIPVVLTLGKIASINATTLLAGPLGLAAGWLITLATGLMVGAAAFAISYFFNRRGAPVRKIGILLLPYNLDNFTQISDQLAEFDGKIFVLDKEEMIKHVETVKTPPNLIFVPCDPNDEATIIERARELELEHLISFAELGLMTCAKARERLGLPGHGSDVELNSTDKHRMRSRLAAAGLTKVKSARCDIEALERTLTGFGLPAIVKPVNLTGSIGVQLIEQIDEIRQYAVRLEKNTYANNSALVAETYVSGDEYSVEGILADGVVHIYGVCEKKTTGAPYFVETGHSFFPEHELIPHLQSSLVAVFEVLGMVSCPFHVEFKMIDGQIEIIEIHSRFGGGFITKLIEYSLGNKVFLDYARYLTDRASPAIDRQGKSIVAIQFAAVPAGVVESIEAIDLGAAPGLIDHKISVQVGDKITPQTGYFDRPAHFIYSVNDRSRDSDLREFFSDFKVHVA